ncbi:FAD-dependent 5-carboxymethylaminomethyl-2-thiouridine(34) oxidoreductase MnmC [Marinobacter salexigens]|uniref:tRNA 5-methylaminomethyl-2-thiouridine biosynthesis bifunctional protein MnmC n=1 Tax=Marinobacter salexigens TaxID=1925763 RepID=A0ABS6A7J4_9GAMM|nr:FAD-dependent 5-carboxymethylaminomethyl-2-thiouridine(34) oxidoreductase MnmC [Marinobacter salexigens]MBU2873932.1 FAD-dependent 5-carboxymethylaminomethyl-2-thiouridine(34) oxidoreductase MnmC [Marinobacter salexigens]
MTSTPKPPAVQPAELHWHDGIPASKHGGPYFPPTKGSEGPLHAHINPNDLPARFTEVPKAGSFVIAENSFGAGLNFLGAWQAWQMFGPSHAATLHFISAESSPLNRKDLESVLSSYPEFDDFSKQLLAHYPPLTTGTHRLVLADGRIRLTLFFGEINTAWEELCFLADAWFLHGNVLTTNQESIQDATIQQICKHSKPGTTLSITSIADNHRQVLETAGFRLLTCTSAEDRPATFYGYFQSASAPITEPTVPNKPATSIAIIGAGIAGCMLADNLAQRGYEVTLIDAASGAGSAASGNLQGAMYVKLGVEFNHQTQLALSALTFSQQYYDSHGGQFWHPTGLLQLAWSDSERDRQRRFVERNQYPKELLRPVPKEEAEILTGARLETGGLWFPGSGWLEPRELCKSLASNIDVYKVMGSSVSELIAYDGKWHLSTTNPNDPKLIADQVVICAGHLSPQLIPSSSPFRFKAIRGQVTHLPEAFAPSPRAVICGARYLNPAHNLQGQQLGVIGATFDLHSDEPETTTESHRENILALSAMVPQILQADLAKGDLPEKLAGRVGFRCTTHDYQPVAGKYCDDQGREMKGLYLLTGLGSKGLTYAPLLTEFVADQITGQPDALPKSLARRLATRRMHQPKVAAS